MSFLGGTFALDIYHVQWSRPAVRLMMRDWIIHHHSPGTTSVPVHGCWLIPPNSMPDLEGSTWIISIRMGMDGEYRCFAKGWTRGLANTSGAQWGLDVPVRAKKAGELLNICHRFRYNDGRVFVEIGVDNPTSHICRFSGPGYRGSMISRRRCVSSRNSCCDGGWL